LNKVTLKNTGKKAEKQAIQGLSCGFFLPRHKSLLDHIWIGVFIIEQLMAAQNLSKMAMALRMNTSRADLNRLLDSANPSVTLQTLERAASVLGKRLQVELV
jgi:hypothetical protein